MSDRPTSREAGEPRREVLHGVLDRIVFSGETSGWTVARVHVRGRREPVTAVGSLLGVQPGERLRLSGRWTVDPRYGEQFRVEGFATLQPATLTGIEKYLGSGLVHGVGPKTAARLVARFGLATLDVIESSPERLTEVDGIGGVRAARIRAAWAEQKAIRDVMVFLQGHALSPALAVRIYRRYRDAAVAVVREDPYRLADEVSGIGFLTADRIARSLGIAADDPSRVAAGIVHTLNRMADAGHVYCLRADLVTAAAAVLTSPGADGAGLLAPTVEARLEHLLAEGRLHLDVAGGEDRVLLPALDTCERGVAGTLVRLLGRRSASVPPEAAADLIARYEARRDIRLSPLQREAVALALGERVLIVTGGPGTGKTTLVRGIVEIQGARGRRVALCAPTGRAAQRLAEATGQEAKTIHRLLEVDPATGGFQRGEQHPVEADLLLADEASMIDVVLMHHLLGAVPPSAQLILVGDADQLPSVGPGNVLGDIIGSGTLPVVRLTEVFRQARESRIVQSAHRIRRGEVPLTNGGRDDFFWIEKEDPEAVLGLVKRLVAQDIPRRFGLSPERDIQVLAPMRRGGLGVDNLNVELQALLNPTGRAIHRGGRDFRVGDRVMQLENDYERDVFNGDLGRIERLDEEEGSLVVRVGDRAVAYDLRDLGALSLAYACSIHKAQGSEYPAVVIPLHTQHYMMLRRRLLYTAVTRGRQLVVIVGSRRAMSIALRGSNDPPRHTLLAERLRRAAAALPDRPPPS